MGIARIASPSSKERSEDEDKERRDEMEILFLVLRNFELFFRFFGTRYGYCENRVA